MTNIVKHEEKTISKKDILRELFALLLWLYVFLKITIFDFDVYLIQNYLPSLTWLITYKFFVLLVFLTILIIISKGKNLLITFVFISIYPLFLLFWRIPKLLFKTRSWIGIFASIEIVISFFKSVKLNFITFTLVLISGLLIVVSGSRYSLVPSIIILFLFLILHFFKRLKYAFKPFNVFSLQSHAITNFWRKVQDQLKLADEIKMRNREDLSEQEQTQWSNNLQFSLILNKACHFLISKLHNFRKSRIVLLYSLSSLVYTVFLTILVFGFLNLALFKIDLNSFSDLPKGGFISFLYYSFNTIFTNSIIDFYPISSFSRLFNSVEIFFGFLILVILFFLLTTILREKHDEEIGGVITAINDQAVIIEEFINKEFNLTVTQAVAEIEKIKGSMLKIINYLISNIN